jgi:hypothetical protein
MAIEQGEAGSPLVSEQLPKIEIPEQQSTAGRPEGLESHGQAALENLQRLRAEGADSGVIKRAEDIVEQAAALDKQNRADEARADIDKILGGDSGTRYEEAPGLVPTEVVHNPGVAEERSESRNAALAGEDDPNKISNTLNGL